jgi:hypothetical protein
MKRKKIIRCGWVKRSCVQCFAGNFGSSLFTGKQKRPEAMEMSSHSTFKETDTNKQKSSVMNSLLWTFFDSLSLNLLTTREVISMRTKETKHVNLTFLLITFERDLN